MSRALARAAIVGWTLASAFGATAAGEVPANKAGKVKLESLPATTVLALPIRGTYEQHPDALARLMGYAAPKGVVRGAPLGIYYNDPERVPPDSLRWEVAVPVPAGTRADAPFVVRTLPAMEAAVVICTGPYEGAGSCYAALSAWVEKHGYLAPGPVQEHWLSDPSTPPEKMQSKIVFPVMKITPATKR
jgi:AraC family transcriptional regulator